MALNWIAFRGCNSFQRPLFVSQQKKKAWKGINCFRSTWNCLFCCKQIQAIECLKFTAFLRFKNLSSSGVHEFCGEIWIILRKYWKSQVSFRHHLVSRRTLYVALNISGVEKATRKNWQLQVLWCSFAETNLKKKKWFWNWEKNILFNVVLSEL